MTEKAQLICEFMYIPNPGISLDCEFNPTSFKLEKKANYEGNPTPLRDFPVSNYTGGSAATFSISLIFDSYAKAPPHDVRKDVNFLNAMTLRTAGFSAAGYGSGFIAEPPIVHFVWGKMALFRAVITSVTSTFSNFTPEGLPTHAVCDVDFLEKNHKLDFLPPQNPSTRTDPRRTTQVMPKDRLDLIAAHEYGDSRRWRTIAEANNIDNPFDLQDGTLLSLPQNF